MPAASTEQLVAAALADPARISKLLAKIESQERLRDYARVIWEIIEPGRPLVGGWPLDCLCEHLEAITSGQIRRLLVNIPPGCMKSLMLNVVWPTWEWGPRAMPHLRYLLASYSKKLSIRDNRKSRMIVESELYQSLWGDTVQIVSDSNAKERFDNSQAGFRLATSVTGLGTGERGDRFLIDDPHNVKQADSVAMRESALDWFANTVPTRINDAEKSVIVVIMQRVHDQDVSGLILKSELNYEWLCLPMEFEARHRCFTSVPRDGVEPEKVTRFRREGEPIPRWLTEAEFTEEQSRGGSPIITRPIFQELYPQDRRTTEGELLWPERFSARHLEEDLKPQLRSWGGTYAEAGQLQQRPAPREGGLFQRRDFRIEDRAPDGAGVWVRGWDLAASKEGHSAFTVGVKMGIVGGAVWITDVDRRRASPAGVEAMLAACCARDGNEVEQCIPQDPGQAGKYQKAALAKVLHGRRFSFSPESGSKEDRARGLAAQAEAGNLYLLRGSWNDAFIDEACLFPNGEFLDQIDAASRAYGRLVVRPVIGGNAAPVMIGG